VTRQTECCLHTGRETADGIGPPVKLAASEKPALPPVSRDMAGGRVVETSDGSWEAFVGKMACKGELLALDREEQIVVKQQMLDRLMLLERELQERTGVLLQPYFVHNSCEKRDDGHNVAHRQLPMTQTVTSTGAARP